MFSFQLWGWNTFAQSSGPALRGYLATHDPSTIVQCKDRYYVFYTGQGILTKSSADRVFWSPGPSVFNKAPSWTTNAVPGFTGLFWAPDVLYFNDEYHLWYAVSTFGSQVSAIGLATNPTLDPTDPAYKWTDHGPVIQSTNGSPYNTIDPSFSWDSSSNLWMAFGSYWNGIYIVQLDQTTGMRIAPNSATTRLAYNSSIEASYLFHRGGYYYLFANWGSCCSGVNSTYNMRVGRSTSVTGPYFDRDGVNMVDNGGSLFQEGTGKFTGPGQVGILSINGAEWLSYHYYDANAWAPQFDAYGAPELAVVPLSWTADDWPAFTNNWAAIYKFQADARDECGQYYGLLENGASVQSDPVYGHILNLDGTNHYVWLPPGVANARTFVAVVKWRGGAPWQRIFDFGFDTTRTVMLTAASGDNVLRCDLNPGNDLETVQWTKPLPTNVWTQVAVTFDGSQGILYVNGRAVATNTGMNLLPLNVAAQTNHLGRSKFTNDPYFNGEYAGFRSYARTLSPQEIIAPVPVISQPADGSTYAPGSLITFAGSATDFSAAPLSVSQMTWQVNYTQNGATNIVLGPLSGVAGGTFQIPSNGSSATNGCYQFVLVATDSAGRGATNAIAIYPSTTGGVSNWGSFYPFATGAQDSSNLNNGMLQGASIRSDPVRGNVLNLSGASQFVSLPAETGTAQTISGWVKWSGGNDWQRIFDFGQSDQDYFFLTPSDSSGLIQCSITPEIGVYNQVIESTIRFPVNQWTQVAVVMDGREGILCLNGNAIAVNNSVNLLPSDIAATRCYIGKSQYPSDPYFAGLMSDFSLNSAPLALAQLIVPLAVITLPTNGAQYAGGTTLSFAGSATDYSGKALPATAFSWSGEFYDDGLLDSAFAPLNGATAGSYDIPTNGPDSTNVYYRVSLTVTDTNGYQQSVSRDVFPETASLTLATAPGGLAITFDGQPMTGSTSLVEVVGMNHVVGAPSPQTLDGTNYNFVLWSDGGAATHNFVVPPINTTLTASFVEPAISVTPNGSGVILSWPDWAGTLDLYTTTNLAAPTWTLVSNASGSSNHTLTVMAPTTNVMQFYRLQSP